jgi:CLIP-associating protein 1/2
VVKLVAREFLLRQLPSTVPGLLLGYDDSDSRVRKAAVFCLVNIYIQVGEELRPYLADLNSSKVGIGGQDTVTLFFFNENFLDGILLILC